MTYTNQKTLFRHKSYLKMVFNFNTKRSMLFVCVFVILLTGVNSETGSVNSLFESIENVENIKDSFIGILETAVNKTSSVSDFIYALFPEIEDIDFEDENLDVIKIDLNEFEANAQELGKLLDKNEDGEITMDEVTPLNSDRKKKVDEILKEIVEIQRNIDVKFEVQDGEYYDEDMNLYPEDEDLIDLDEDILDIHDEL